MRCFSVYFSDNLPFHPLKVHLILIKNVNIVPRAFLYVVSAPTTWGKALGTRLKKRALLFFTTRGMLNLYFKKQMKKSRPCTLGFHTIPRDTKDNKHSGHVGVPNKRKNQNSFVKSTLTWPP